MFLDCMIDLTAVRCKVTSGQLHLDGCLTSNCKIFWLFFAIRKTHLALSHKAHHLWCLGTSRVDLWAHPRPL